VDDNGNIVGVISAHDVRLVGSGGDLLEHLYVDYPTYKKLLSSKYKIPSHPVVVSSSATLSDVIETLIENKIHRVFIVDNGKDGSSVLGGVVSYCDVLENMLHHK